MVSSYTGTLQKLFGHPCLRGSRTIRKIRCNIENIDLDVDVETNTGRIN